MKTHPSNPRSVRERGAPRLARMHAGGSLHLLLVIRYNDHHQETEGSKRDGTGKPNAQEEAASTLSGQGRNSLCGPPFH